VPLSNALGPVAHFARHPPHHAPVSIRAFTGAATLLVAAAVALPAQQPADSVRAAVDRVFAQWKSQDAPGCAVGASRNGKTVYEAGYGAANLEDGVPITPASIFHAASISKQFTATAVLLLVREGKLSLDADVRTYLPELPDYGHRITLRHLLTHTSGLRDQWDLLAIPADASKRIASPKPTCSTS
jgi:CubicO group peptidase (beta-lactamase class C family)